MEFKVSKDNSKKAGIYAIRNIIDDRIYIGSTNIFKKRYDNHRNDLQRGIHCSKYLQRFYNKYGKDSIYFSIIEIVNDLSILVEREQHYLDKYQPFGKRGFNGSRIAYSMIGYKHSKESKKRMSIGQKNRKPPSEETRKKISLATRGENNPIYGKCRPLEVRLKAASKLSRSVVQFGSTGEFLNIYESLSEASLKTGVKKEAIRSAARKRSKFGGSYKWSYLDDGERKTLSDKRILDMKKIGAVKSYN